MYDRLGQDANARQAIGKKTLHKLLASLAKRRRRSQQGIVDCVEDVQRASPYRDLKKLDKKIRWRGAGPEPRFRDVARHRLNRLAVAFDQAGQSAQAAAPADNSTASESHVELLHEWRICGKRLRYAMELSISVVGDDIRRPYESIAEIQEVLGQINDHAVSRDLFRYWGSAEKSAKLQTAFTELADVEQRALQECLIHFPNWWTPERQQAFWGIWNDVVGGVRSKKRGA